MDQVTTVRRRMKCEQWKSIISEYRSSGMTVTAWCKENGICEQTNLKKFRTEALESAPAPLVASADKPVVFEKLEVQTPVPGTRVAAIIHLAQATLEISEGTSQQTIQAVLLALQSVC